MVLLIVGVILVFSFASCNLTCPLNGTWDDRRGHMYTFRGNKYSDGTSWGSGTFSLNNEKTQLTIRTTYWNQRPTNKVQIFNIEFRSNPDRFILTDGSLGVHVTFHRIKR